LQIDISDFVPSINKYVDQLIDRYESVEDPIFLQNVALHAQDLPAVLRKGLLSFKLNETDGVCHVTGFPIHDEQIGPTPAHWRNKVTNNPTRREDFYLILCSHLLGDTVAWATEQGGNLVHEVFPIKGNDGGQLGTSTDKLAWHTEDAFHPERMDYVALLCLRNHDAVATTYASVDDLDLDNETKAQLFRPAYPFLPDEGNRADRELSPAETSLVADLVKRSHERVLQMFSAPEQVPALFGDAHAPYLRVHPHYIGDFGDDLPAFNAFERLKSAVNSALKDIVLRPGDLFFIDNFKSVHGRREIPGRFDGTDRWLKRAFVVRDLRKSRSLRTAASGRIVY